MPRYNVIMTKTGNDTVGYLRTWEPTATGTKFSFGATRDQALSFDAREAVGIVTALRNEQPDTTIKYTTIVAGDS